MIQNIYQILKIAYQLKKKTIFRLICFINFHPNKLDKKVRKSRTWLFHHLGVTYLHIIFIVQIIFYNYITEVANLWYLCVPEVALKVKFQWHAKIKYHKILYGANEKRKHFYKLFECFFNDFMKFKL